MKRGLNESIRNQLMSRRQLLALGLLGAASCMMPTLVGNASVSQDDLEIVSIMPEMAEREGPLVAFRDFVVDADVEVRRHIRRQMNRKNDLYALLKKKIEFDKQVQLSVEDVKVRLMYVPQRPEGPGAAY